MTLPLKLGTGRLAVAAGLTSALVLANPAPSQAAGMAPAAAPGLGFGAVLPIQAPAAPGPNVEANLAQLHQRLQITPVQQAKFDTFANVMRENSRMAPAPAPANPTAVEDLRTRHPRQRARAPRLEAAAAGDAGALREPHAGPAEDRRSGVSPGRPRRVTSMPGLFRFSSAADQPKDPPMPNSALPLNDFLVLDLTAHRAGPTAVRQLADWGADVIKIEPPGEAESTPPAAAATASTSRTCTATSASMTLNLKTPGGARDLYASWPGRADVVVENYRSDVKHRLGVDYETVKAINPRIVYGSISGFGQDGPDAGRPGVDQIAQGMGGLMSITGLPGQGPVRVGIADRRPDLGHPPVAGIVLALMQREHTGEGQWVHTSLLEAQIFMLDFQASRWLIAGRGRRPGRQFPSRPRPAPACSRPPTATSTSPPRATICGNASARSIGWQGRCSTIPTSPPSSPALEKPHGAESPISTRSCGRSQALTGWKLLNKAGVPCGPINTIDRPLPTRRRSISASPSRSTIPGTGRHSAWSASRSI